MSTLFGEPDVPLADPLDAAIVAAYERAGRSLDDLPYTPDFDRLFTLVTAAVPMFERGHADGYAARRAVLHRLLNLRKASKLPKLGAGRSNPPALTAEDEATLRELVASAAGSLGQRDQLPYTVKFDELHGSFNARTGRTLTPHDLWRVVAKLAK